MALFGGSDGPRGAGNMDGRQRKILHIDMDASYASVEQRDDPELRGKPVAVGGARAGRGSGRQLRGPQVRVRSAMPSVTARRKCGDLIFVKPRFDVYRAVSHQIRAIFGEYTPRIEPLSLDEAYLDVTENLKAMASATAIAEEIRARVFAETSLTASAGISYNKFLAKMASDERKPNGQFVITPKMGPAYIEGLPMGKFHGIGPAPTTVAEIMAWFEAVAGHREEAPTPFQWGGRRSGRVDGSGSVATGRADRGHAPGRPSTEAGFEVRATGNANGPLALGRLVELLGHLEYLFGMVIRRERRADARQLDMVSGRLRRRVDDLGDAAVRHRAFPDLPDVAIVIRAESVELGVATHVHVLLRFREDLVADLGIGSIFVRSVPVSFWIALA